MRALEYPFDPDAILRNRRKLRRELLETSAPRQPVRMAVLGGSTTAEITKVLELFLLHKGFAPTFFESAYNRYFDDVMAPNPSLVDFRPQLVYVHTSVVNVRRLPNAQDSEATVRALLEEEISRYRHMWTRIGALFGCAIVQNNFDPPPNRPLGNLDGYVPQGRVRFVNELNRAFGEEAAANKQLFINDINYLCATIGIDNWWDPVAYFAYKSAVRYSAIPFLCHNLANVVAAILGKSRKCLAVDLDNTLWGGIIGDDGLTGIKTSQGDPVGEAHQAFQEYLKELRRRGVVLAVSSRNHPAVAREGFTHPDLRVTIDDFSAFNATWGDKAASISQITTELNLGLDGVVFVDDSPAERERVRLALPDVAVPEIGSEVERFLPILDRSGFFEPTSLEEEDRKRPQYYRDNARREEAVRNFLDHDSYLRHLEMRAEIAPFAASYTDRITQLINKTNQFNLTGRRCTTAEVVSFTDSPSHMALYGRLHDRFGDNGLTSVLIAEIGDGAASITVWVMSCRVFQRHFELAMFDRFVEECLRRGIHSVRGCYVPSPRNAMVAGLYATLGFEQQANEVDRWELTISESYQRKNLYIGFAS